MPRTARTSSGLVDIGSYPADVKILQYVGCKKHIVVNGDAVEEKTPSTALP